MTNMAFESMEEYFNRNLWARAQIQVTEAQLVYPAHEIHSYFENRRGKQLLLKGRECYGNKFGNVCQEKILAERKAV